MSEKVQQDSSPQPLIRDFGDGRTSRWGLDEGDMSLIDLMLEMTPTERIHALTTFARSVEKLRSARRL